MSLLTLNCKRVAACLAVLGVLTGEAASLIWRDDLDEAGYVDNNPGSPTLPVVALLRKHDLDAGAPAAFCSATIVAPRCVLTAGHCLYDAVANQPKQASDIVVTTAPSTINVNPTPAVTAASIIPYPGFVLTQPHPQVGHAPLGDRPDLGVIVLSDDLGTDAMDISSSADAAAVGAEIILVGYGRGGNGSVGDLPDTFPAGKRRIGFNRIDAASQSFLYPGETVRYQFKSPSDVSPADYREANITTGDSGGALIVKNNAGYLLAGVHSGTRDVLSGTLTQLFGKGTYGSYGFSTELSTYRSWILDACSGR